MTSAGSRENGVGMNETETDLPDSLLAADLRQAQWEAMPRWIAPRLTPNTLSRRELAATKRAVLYHGACLVASATWWE